MSRSKPQPINTDEFLTEEYEYIVQTAAQANEDRARISSFYLIAVGSLIAAIFGTQFFDPDFFTQGIKFTFSGVFLLLTLMGTSTIVQLARLRAAWYESMLAMNQIKDFAMKQNPELKNAFRWKSETLPAKYKTDSVSYYQAVEVALIGGLMFGAATFFLQEAFFVVSFSHWAISTLFGMLAIYIQLLIYKRTLK